MNRMQYERRDGRNKNENSHEITILHKIHQELCKYKYADNPKY